MTTLNSIVWGQARAQIYRLDSDISAERLAAVISAAGGSLFFLDGDKMTSKEQLMQEFAAVLDFPDYFGANWDALQECLTDCIWWRGESTHQVLFLDSWEKCASPALIEALQDAIAEWILDGKLIYILLRTTVPDEYMRSLGGLS